MFRILDYTIYFLAAAIVILAIFIWVRSWIYKKITGRKLLQDGKDFNRGFFELIRFYCSAEPRKMKKSTLKKMSWENCGGIPLGKTEDGRLIFNEYGNDCNYAFVGSPKSGKTQTMMCSMLAFKGSVLAVDLKGDIVEKIEKHRSIKVLNLAEPSKSAHFNPLHGIDKLSIEERVKFVKRLSYVFFPMPVDGKKDDYFTKNARNFFRGICLYALDQNPCTTFPKIVNAIMLGNADLWIEKIYESNCCEAKKCTDHLRGTNSTNYNGCYSDLCDVIENFDLPTITELLTPCDDCITIDTLENYDVYLRLPQADTDTYEVLTSLFFSIMVNGLFGRSECSERHILVCLDEIGNYPRIYKLEEALSTLRSKSVSFLLGFQSLAQLINRYGKTGKETLLDCITNTVLFNLESVETRKEYADKIGYKKALRRSNSLNLDNSTYNTSIGDQANEIDEYVITPADLGTLKERGKAMVLQGGYYYLSDKVQLYQSKIFSA